MTQDADVIRSWIESIQDNGRGLSKWEQDFVESVAEQMERSNSVSDRQEEILERIYAEKTP
jgi:hypothetical protein